MAARGASMTTPPMECTGGFKALRNHVKLTKDTKDGASRTGTLLPQAGSSQSEREQEWDASKPLRQLECPNDGQPNQERRSQEKHQLHIIRLALAKEQREIKTRERSVKSMEAALQEAMDRTADKEKSLDQRIQDIARLEQRLHEALSANTSASQKSPRDAPPTNQADYTHETRQREVEERETTLALREQELAMARDRVADRERHLSTKERVLRDKAVELNLLEAEMQKKHAQHVVIADQRLAEREQDLLLRHEAHEQELVERFQLQLASLTAEFEAKQRQLDTQLAAANATVHDQASQFAERVAALQQSELALVASRNTLNREIDMLLVAQEAARMADADVSSRLAALEAQRAELLQRIAETEEAKQQHEEAGAELKRQETKLALFAAEVEAQAQLNALRRGQLDDERAAFASKMSMAMVTSTNPSTTPAVSSTDATTSEHPPHDTHASQQTTKPPRTRSFTSGLFRSKSTTRA